MEEAAARRADSGKLAFGGMPFFEPVAALATAAMRRRAGDVLAPGPCSQSAALAFGATPLEVLRQLTGRATSASEGRAGGLSWTDVERGLFGWDGRPGVLTQLLAGAALSFRMRGEPRAAIVFEDAAAEDAGGWHEGMSVAGALKLPLIAILLFPHDAPLEALANRLNRLASSYGARGETLMGAPEGIFAAARRARLRAAEGQGPTLLALQGTSRARALDRMKEVRSWAVKASPLSSARRQRIREAAEAAVRIGFDRVELEPPADPNRALARVTGQGPVQRPWTRTRGAPLRRLERFARVRGDLS